MSARLVFRLASSASRSNPASYSRFCRSPRTVLPLHVAFRPAPFVACRRFASSFDEDDDDIDTDDYRHSSLDDEGGKAKLRIPKKLKAKLKSGALDDDDDDLPQSVKLSKRAKDLLKAGEDETAASAAREGDKEDDDEDESDDYVRVSKKSLVKRNQVTLVDERGRAAGKMTLEDAYQVALKKSCRLVQMFNEPPTYQFVPSGGRSNEDILYATLRVIGTEGDEIGIMSTDEAVARARQLNLDVFIVDDAEDPPTARLGNYGKYKYHESKKKKPVQTKMKTVRFGAFSADNDIDTHIRQAVKFLEKGKIVRAVVHFRRKRDFDEEHGRQSLLYLKTELEPYGHTDVNAMTVVEGRSLYLTFTPKK